MSRHREEYDEPGDSEDRVNHVLKRASALSDELRTTIAELTRMLRAEGEGVVSGDKSTH